jgi:hypothetical protein
LRETAILLSLLAVGLYLPTSVNGEYAVPFYQASLLIALCLLSCLAWAGGVLPGVGRWTVLPTAIVLLGCTLITVALYSDPIAWGTAFEYCLLMLVLSLDLRSIRLSRFIRTAIAGANVIGIVGGVGILTGNESVGAFVLDHYSAFYPELVSNMLLLHKPILTFSTHSLAGFFLYLFFWLNWETYKLRRSILALVFASSWLILLGALVSFTSLGFAALALAQIGVWLWKHNPVALVTVTICLLAGTFVGLHMLQDALDLDDPLEIAAGLLSSDVSGPLARYGAGGGEQEHIQYLLDHPLSPVGFSGPVSNATVDSAPLVYLLRGSVPLLLLIYFGLYRFLRLNLGATGIALTLFLVIVAFETGFTVLAYFRTFYLLPIVVIYLNNLNPQERDAGVLTTV